MTHSDVRGSETPKGRVQDLSHLSYQSIVGVRFHSDKLEPRNANKLKIASTPNASAEDSPFSVQKKCFSHNSMLPEGLLSTAVKVTPNQNFDNYFIN